MAVETFNFRVTSATQGTVNHRVLSAQFGDGYRQTAGDGINTKSETWSVKITGSKSEIMSVRNFLNSHGSWKSFKWTTPFGEELFFKAGDYTPSPLGGDVYQLDVDFTEDHKP